MPESIKDKYRRYLIGSILLSLIFHVGELYFFQRQSLWFSFGSPQKNVIQEHLLSSEKTNKDHFLKETFASIPEIIHAKKIESPRLTEELKVLPPLLPSTILPNPSIHNLSLQTSEFSSLSLWGENSRPQLAPLFENISLPQSLPKIEREKKEVEKLSQDQKILNPISSLIPIKQEINRDAIETPNPIQPLCLETNTIDHYELGRIPSEPMKTPQLPPIPKIPSLSDLQTTSYSTHFDTELTFIEQENGKYLFALTLFMKEDIKIPHLKQNYLFLIDRSNSIQKERLNATKNAVHKALEELAPTDQFNIIVFDQKIEKFSHTEVPATPEAIAKGQQFLNKIELGSFFTQKDLYKPLFVSIPHTASQNELHTVILMTDGENLSNQDNAFSLLHDWTYLNRGKVSLYTLSMAEDPNLDTLETLSLFNLGKGIYSQTHRGLKRKLMKLMKTIHAPIAKKLSCKAISKNSQETIELLPESRIAPPLFLNEPYVLFGTANSLEDFVLFIQGKVDGKWLHIKKNISFIQAKKGNGSLKFEWAHHKALSLYQQYLETSDIHSLAEAQDLIKIYDLPDIFNIQKSSF